MISLLAADTAHPDRLGHLERGLRAVTGDDADAVEVRQLLLVEKLVLLERMNRSADSRRRSARPCR